MEPPQSMDADNIHEAKVMAIEQLRFDKAIIGQYEGYTDELAAIGKATNSNTETYAEIHLKSISKRWRNTPIIFKSGKNLDKRCALIELCYRKEPCILYCDIKTFPNRLVLNIQPIQDIEFYMNTKVPKRDLEIKHIKLNFSSESEFLSNSSESYENILEECIIGDKTLFISSQEIEAAWKLVDTIRKYTSKMKSIIYKKGSKGPIAGKESHE
jgi:glucose-6-phosphate 1-dehydrogenase